MKEDQANQRPPCRGRHEVPRSAACRQMAAISIMSKTWAEKNNAVNAADMTKNEGELRTCNAMGTGPFMR